MTEQEYQIELERLQKENEVFQLLPKEEKAIYIAKDVIQSVLSKKIEVKRGNYGRINYLDINELSSKYTDFQELIIKSKKCTVCALGFCFFELIKKQGNFKTNQFSESKSELQLIIREKLSSVFNYFDLSLIETAFESRRIFADFDDDNFTEEEIRLLDLALSYSEFVERNYDSTEVLLHIMCNIINNKGKFDPEWNLLTSQNLEQYSTELINTIKPLVEKSKE